MPLVISDSYPAELEYAADEFSGAVPEVETVLADVTVYVTCAQKPAIVPNTKKHALISTRFRYPYFTLQRGDIVSDISINSTTD